MPGTSDGIAYGDRGSLMLRVETVHCTFTGALRRKRRAALALTVVAALVTGCGAGGISAETSASRTQYVNPTSGALPSYASSKDLVSAAGGDCAWQFTTTKRGDQLAGCARDGVVVEVFSVGSEPFTLEKVRQSEASPGDFCLWWSFMLLAYYVGVTQLRDASAPPSASGDTSASPTPIPPATTGLVGANWIAFARDPGAAATFAHGAGGYLIQPSGVCPSATGR